MKPLLLFLLATLPRFACAEPAPAALFYCELGEASIEVSRAEDGQLTARSPKLGELGRADCAEAASRFGAQSVGEHCFVTADGRFLLDFQGSPERAVAALLQDAHGNFDVCVKRRAL